VEYNVRLKPSKCSFGFEEVEFVGHIFNKMGYHMSDARKQGIIDMAAPTSVKQLRSFLGMVNFFRDFIPQLSQALGSLTELTKKSAQKMFQWTESAESAFVKTKGLIADSTALYQLDEVGKVTLYTDASKAGIGGTLMQIQEYMERPILFISHKFSAAAQNWSTIEQECYAVFYCVLRLQQYLLGRHFYIATDHRNLIYLQNSIVPKVIRWRLRLMEFSFTVYHIPGKENVIADVLSRHLRMVRVHMGEEVARPMDTSVVLGEYHNTMVGHNGVTRTLAMMREKGVQWSGMQSDVAKYIRVCPVCQKVKRQRTPHPPVSVYTLSGHTPMCDLSVDTIGPLPEDGEGYRYILVIIDNFSKYSELYATKNVDAMAYVECIIMHNGMFGVMMSQYSHGGIQFTPKNHNMVLLYHPEANGIVERGNAEGIKHLCAMVLVSVDKARWVLYLPLVQLMLKASPDTSIGTYPLWLLFGNQLQSQGSLLEGMEGRKDEIEMHGSQNYLTLTLTTPMATTKRYDDS
jgi:hypothetical protein